MCAATTLRTVITALLIITTQTMAEEQQPQAPSPNKAEQLSPPAVHDTGNLTPATTAVTGNASNPATSSSTAALDQARADNPATTEKTPKPATPSEPENLNSAAPTSDDRLIRYTFWLTASTCVLTAATIGLLIATFLAGKDTRKAADAAVAAN